MVKILDTLEDFQKAIADSADKLVVIDFFATWCGPCVRISPDIEKLAEDNTDGK